MGGVGSRGAPRGSAGRGPGRQPTAGLRTALLAIGLLAGTGLLGWTLLFRTAAGGARGETATAGSVLRAVGEERPDAGADLAERCRPSPGRPSLLAVGDTGVPPEGPEWGVQLLVGAGLAAVDHLAPVDGLVLLGDNFYPHGLRAEELARRARANLLEPYGFLGAGNAARSGWAGTPPGRRGGRPPSLGGGGSPRPIHAVFGNHDWKSPESPELQRTALPELVPGWQPPPETAETREVGPGLSLVLFDSRWLADTGATAELARALRAARGPFVVLASHVPSSLDRRPEGVRPWDLRYTAFVEEAVRRSGRPVHLRLAGHEHNLQAIELVSVGGGLEVIAGSGARPQPVRQIHLGRLFASSRPGFARVAVRPGAAGREDHLVVELYEVREGGRGGRVALAARFEVDREGLLRVSAFLPCPSMEAGPAGSGGG